MKVISKIEDWYNEYARTCEFIAKLLIKRSKIKPNSTIVDLGCGTGVFTIPLALKVRKSKIIAVDNDKKSLNELKAKIERLKVRNIVVIKGDARKLTKIKDNSIDFVFSHWLLGVVTKYNDLKQTLKECYRILKKGGIVAHSESYSIPKNKAQELYMRADVLAWHTRWWSVNEIKELMRSIGFRKIKIKLIDFDLKINPKISIPLIREWQKLEYSFTKKESAIKNVKLESFLNSNKNEIEKYGLEFPTEYIIFATK
jgi:ubiquinone/menaquinone biosynthesis C-methylase UbiE